MSIVAFDYRLDCVKNEESREKVLDLIANIERYGALTATLLYSLPIYAYISTKEWKEFVQTSDYIFKFVQVYLKLRPIQYLISY
jgi:hypothetical protein